MEVGRTICAVTWKLTSDQGSPPLLVDVDVELELEEEQLAFVIGIRRPMCALSCLTCAAYVTTTNAHNPSTNTVTPSNPLVFFTIELITRRIERDL